MIFISRFLKKGNGDLRKIEDIEKEVNKLLTKSREKREFIEKKIEKYCELDYCNK